MFVPTRFASIVPFLLVGSGLVGCHDRVYDFGGTLRPIDASVTQVGAAGSGGGDASGDGVAGSGGAGDRAAGGGGMGGGGAGGTGGAIQTCEDNSPDRMTDLANCGKCFNLCVAPNSDSQCVGGKCVYTCQGGFFDADKNPANGCECVKTSDTEVCDGIDNNCNGTVDEGFDFKGDVDNCGGCNKRCFYPFAKATCDAGVCKQGACLEGYYDRDPNLPGCETACQKTNGGVEICDGLDNDCNGIIDDKAAAPTIACKSKGVCVGTNPTCAGASGWVCNYPSAYQDIEDKARGCDGLDNNCNGVVDESFAIGRACIVGTGPCAGTGVWVCDHTQPSDRSCSGSTKAPGIEVCNGKDDNCNGEVDELNSKSDRTADDVVVYFPDQNVTMFAFEATRYDATATEHGFDSTRRPCSVPGKQPWNNVTKEEAEAACEKTGTGWRLCTAAEWFDACNGSGNTTFPYGNTYDGMKCNGFDFTFPATAATVPTGSDAMCISNLSAGASDKLYDLSGNVKEWTITGAASASAAGPYELRGGAYDIASFLDNSVTPPARRAPGLQCDASTPAPTVAVRLPSVGFRCCRSGTLPP